MFCDKTYFPKRKSYGMNLLLVLTCEKPEKKNGRIEFLILEKMTLQTDCSDFLKAFPIPREYVNTYGTTIRCLLTNIASLLTDCPSLETALQELETVENGAKYVKNIETFTTLLSSVPEGGDIIRICVEAPLQKCFSMLQCPVLQPMTVGAFCFGVFADATKMCVRPEETPVGVGCFLASYRLRASGSPHHALCVWPSGSKWLAFNGYVDESCLVKSVDLHAQTWELVETINLFLPSTNNTSVLTDDVTPEEELRRLQLCLGNKPVAAMIHHLSCRISENPVQNAKSRIRIFVMDRLSHTSNNDDQQAATTQNKYVRLCMVAYPQICEFAKVRPTTATSAVSESENDTAGGVATTEESPENSAGGRRVRFHPSVQPVDPTPVSTVRQPRVQRRQRQKMNVRQPQQGGTVQMNPDSLTALSDNSEQIVFYQPTAGPSPSPRSSTVTTTTVTPSPTVGTQDFVPNTTMFSGLGTSTAVYIGIGALAVIGGMYFFTRSRSEPQQPRTPPPVAESRNSRAATSRRTTRK